MQENVYGYMRISDAEKTEQLSVMRQKQIPETHIFADQKSDEINKSQYKAMLQILQPGDLLYITNIDQLGRDFQQIRERWNILTKEIGVDISVIELPLLNTNRQQGALLADLVLQVLSDVEQNERKDFKKQQAAGIAAAKTRGVRFGRPSKPLPENFCQIVSLWNEGRLSLPETLELCNMSEATFYRRLREYRQQKIASDKQA